jgi:putative transposase
MLLAPLVRRTWAPSGRTPVFYQRTRFHQKVSVIAALAVSPRRDRVRFFFRCHPQANMDTTRVCDFLRQLTRQLPEPMVLLWDRFRPHKAKKMGRFLRQHPAIHPEFFPPYAPELNPAERPWAYLKMNPLANWAAPEVTELARRTRQHARAIQRTEPLLRSFVTHGPLPLRLV